MAFTDIYRKQVELLHTDAPIELSILLKERQELISDISNQMPEYNKHFLRPFYSRKPDWNLLGIAGAQNLPAVRWREMNLDMLGGGTKETLLEKLEQVIGK